MLFLRIGLYRTHMGPWELGIDEFGVVEIQVGNQLVFQDERVGLDGMTLLDHVDTGIACGHGYLTEACATAACQHTCEASAIA